VAIAPVTRVRVGEAIVTHTGMHETANLIALMKVSDSTLTVVDWLPIGEQAISLLRLEC
jgi:hypothetical protein